MIYYIDTSMCPLSLLSKAKGLHSEDYETVYLYFRDEDA